MTARQTCLSGPVRRNLPALIVVLTGIATLSWATNGFAALTEETARRLHVERDRPLLPQFLLEDMEGRQLTIGAGAESKAIKLVEFIYTSCPTICQTAAGDYARLRDELVERHLDEKVQILSVSFDPLHDGLEEMSTYAEWHGADGVVWNVARARSEDLGSLFHSFGVRVIPDKWGGYQHNAAIHIIDQNGHLIKIVETDDVAGAVSTVEGAL